MLLILVLCLFVERKKFVFKYIYFEEIWSEWVSERIRKTNGSCWIEHSANEAKVSQEMENKCLVYIIVSRLFVVVTGIGNYYKTVLTDKK